MAEKHLHELLKEEQEPFVLKNYINERRCQIKRPLPKTHLQPKGRKPISQNPTFSSNFRKNTFLFTFFDSDPRKSPIFDFHSPPKSPCRSPNTLFTNIPSRTAALLLESALRIQNQSPSSRQKNLGFGFGFFGSVLKRMALRKGTQKKEICGKENPVSVKDILRWDSFQEMREVAEERAGKQLQVHSFSEEDEISEVGFSCSCERSDWWERLEERSVDLESSSSSSSSSSCLERNVDFGSCEMGFSSNSFRFREVEEKPDSGVCTPDFGSPTGTPRHRKTEEQEGAKQLFPSREDAEDKKEQYEEEEDNEQLSPVSVLETPFEDLHEEEDENDEEDGPQSDEFHNSLATVQRSKQQLLNKIRRFERLAALDPFELEKRIAEDEEEEEDDEEDREGEYNDGDSDFCGNRRGGELPVESEHENMEEFVKKVLTPLGVRLQCRLIPSNTKGLVFDLAEEEREKGTTDREVLVKKVAMKMESWKNVDSNTIHMSVEQDFSRESDEWRKNPREVQEMSIQLQCVIFGNLIDELLIDLTCERDHF